MDKIEIYKNLQGIADDKSQCSTAQKAVQSIWNEFNSLGIDLSVNAIFELINATFFSNKNTESTKDSIKNAIIDAQTTEPPKIYGLTISREQLKKMVEIPNLETIVNVLHQCESNFNRVQKYIVIESGKAQIVPDYLAQIELKNTEFAEGEKQIKRANILIKLRDVMNEYLDNDFVSDYDLPDITGLKAHGKRFVIDTYYISRH